MERKPSFTNLSGQNGERHLSRNQLLTPIEKFVGRLFDPSRKGVRFLAEREREDFWTPRRRELAERVFGAVNNEVGKFGVPEMQFDPNNILLYRTIKRKKIWRAGFDNILTGKSGLDEEYVQGENEFLEGLTHETLHRASIQLFWERKNVNYPRRYGLKMMRKSLSHVPGIAGGIQLEQKIFGMAKQFERKNPFTWKKDSLSLLNEAVVDMTTDQILKKHFGLKRQFVPGGYFNLAWILTPLMERIHDDDPDQYPSTLDVLPVFQEATFGRGNALRLGRELAFIFDTKQGLRALAVLLDDINQKKFFETDYFKMKDFPEIRTLLELTDSQWLHTWETPHFNFNYYYDKDRTHQSS